jgi:serine/threonine-protein kinase
VYEALSPSGEKVALKELLFSLVPDAATLDAFNREAKVLASLSHPQIPRLLDAFSEGTGVHTRLYLAQEFVEGEPLQIAIDRQRLTPLEARRLAVQVLRVLEELHGRDPPLLHRDVKPANLVLRPDGRVSLVDFGSARLLPRGVTHGATLVGTFGYMPPEQLGGTVDASCDLYALGATLMHGLTGKRPEDMTRDGLRLDVDAHLGGVDADLRKVIRKLVAPNRAARFQTAREAREALKAPLVSRWRAMALGTAAALVLGFSVALGSWTPAEPARPAWLPYWAQEHPAQLPRPQVGALPALEEPLPESFHWGAYTYPIRVSNVVFPPGYGGIAAITTPKGARVLLDGALLAERTPFTVNFPLQVNAGFHDVRIVHRGRQTALQVEVVPGVITTIRATLVGPPRP